jgi:hypothetical protein
MPDVQCLTHRSHQLNAVWKVKEQYHLEEMINNIREIKSSRY